MLKLCCLLGLSICLLGCATPAEKFAAVANEHGFLSSKIKTDQFELQLFVNDRVISNDASGTLHVYLDGDGTPWIRPSRVAEDPTSRNPLILALLALDTAPALLLGRPCYHQLVTRMACHFQYWTSHRYSKAVVDNMAQALNLWLQKHAYKEVVLIGFSGGGTLAVLMAPKVREVSRVVTVAANLDVAAWSRHHGFMPLEKSLNPADLAIFAQISYIHLVGNDDELVPTSTLAKYLDRNKAAKLIRYEKFDHHCCWSEQWLEILATVIEP